MTSVQANFYQRDNRLETVQLTGYLKDNGTIDGPVGPDTGDKPAYAGINLTKSQNFYINAYDSLTLRTDPGTGIEYYIKIYIDKTTKPPLYYQNLEWNVHIKLPPITYGTTWTAIQVYNSKAEAESVNNNYIFGLSNQADDGDIKQGIATITMQMLDNQIILKSVSPHLFL